MRLAGRTARTPEEIQAEAQVQPSFYVNTDGKRQVWGCLECRVAKRVWGEGRPSPESKSLTPLIGCRFCGRPTRHCYIGIQEGAKQ